MSLPRTVRNSKLPLNLRFLSFLFSVFILASARNLLHRRFVIDHIKDSKVLQKLEDANLTFSREKYAFSQPEILVVGHLCGSYGRKPSPSKVNAIQEMKEECESQTEVRRFLGACAFCHIWIPHYAHVAEPLYGLLKKKRSLNGKTSIPKVEEIIIGSSNIAQRRIHRSIVHHDVMEHSHSTYLCRPILGPVPFSSEA